MPEKSESRISVQYAVPRRGLPSAVRLRRWAEAALGPAPGEVTLRIVDAVEGRALNRQYRGRDYATNVLSFPVPELPDGTRPIRGDLVLCAPVIGREAKEQGKAQDAHWAHMVIHGCLHLCGHDHEDKEEAERMETLERSLLAGLGYPDPYRETSGVEHA
jgi:probable rRNA maturation factor